jgi:hypothetical protein
MLHDSGGLRRSLARAEIWLGQFSLLLKNCWFYLDIFPALHGPVMPLAVSRPSVTAQDLVQSQTTVRYTAFLAERVVLRHVFHQLLRIFLQCRSTNAPGII